MPLLRNLSKYHLSLIIITIYLCSPAIHAFSDVPLEGIDGQKHRLSTFIGNGKWTAVNIWGTRCPPCLEEMPELVLFHDANEQDKATVLGIAIDFPSFGYARKNEVIEFVEDYLISFPILLSDHTIAKHLGVDRLKGLPTTYMFTPEGKLAGHFVGSINRKILQTYIHKYETKQH